MRDDTYLKFCTGCVITNMNAYASSSVRPLLENMFGRMSNVTQRTSSLKAMPTLRMKPRMTHVTQAVRAVKLS